MTWRRIAIYYALAIIFGGYFFAFEWRPGQIFSLESRPTQIDRFLPIPREEIQELVLQRDGAVVSCRKEEERWRVIEPADAQVPPDAVMSFVEDLTPDSEVRVMAENPEDLSAFGLDNPRSTVVMKNKEGNVLATIFIGDQNPAATAVYVQRKGSPRVVLMGYSVSYYRDLIFEAAGFGR